MKPKTSTPNEPPNGPLESKAETSTPTHPQPMKIKSKIKPANGPHEARAKAPTQRKKNYKVKNETALSPTQTNKKTIEAPAAATADASSQPEPDRETKCKASTRIIPHQEDGGNASQTIPSFDPGKIPEVLLSFHGPSDTLEVGGRWDSDRKEMCIHLTYCDGDAGHGVFSSPSKEDLLDCITDMLLEFGLQASAFDEFEIVVNGAPSIISRDDVRNCLGPCFEQGVSERFSSVEHFLEMGYKEGNGDGQHEFPGPPKLDKSAKSEPPLDMEKLKAALEKIDFEENAEIVRRFWEVSSAWTGGSLNTMLSAPQVKMLLGIDEDTLEGLAHIGVLKKAPTRKNPASAWRLVELQKLFCDPKTLLTGRVPGY